MRVLACFALLLVFASAASTPFSPPGGWSAAPDLAMTGATKDVTFVLPVENFDALDLAIALVSSPRSPLYGAYLSQDEVHAMTAPLYPHRLASYTQSLGWACTFESSVWFCPGIPLEEIERHWDVRFRAFRSTLGHTSIRATYGPALPREIADIVSFVSGLGTTPPVRVFKVRPEMSGSSDPSIIPETFRNTYSVPDLYLTTAVSIGAVEYQNYSAFSSTDLQTFAKGLDIPFCQPTHIHGPFLKGPAGDESALDAATIAGLACGSEMHWMTFGGWIWDYAHFCAETPHACPDVSSHSWGWCIKRQCDVDSAACTRWNVTSCDYALRVDQELAKSAVQGKTHVFASGDSGCHGRTDIGCSSPECCAVFPCASRYGTCVSATAAFPNFTHILDPPPACVNMTGPCAASVTQGPCYPNAPSTGCFWTPGGTIATCMPRPFYQFSAVDDFLKSSTPLPPSSDFGTGRGVPDVAALGHNFYLVDNDEWTWIDGTSASTPLFASFLTYVNQARVNAGQPKVGPANAWLYSLAGTPAFHKIHDASNNCTEETCCSTGFVSSDTDWDPVTGLGTPNVSVLVKQ